MQTNKHTILSRLSIKQKLLVIILSICMAGLFVAATILVATEVLNFRAGLIRHLTIDASIIADNAKAALSFRDEKDAAVVLQSLNARPSIENAVILDKEQRIFSQLTDTAWDSHGINLHTPTGYQFIDQALFVWHAIDVDGERIGTVVIQSNLDEIMAFMERSLFIITGVLLLSILVSFLLATQLQKVISDPISYLAAISRKVSAKNDYSLRAEKHAEDEIGQLTDAFNAMLSQIEINNAELHEHRERLEVMVAERTRELQETNYELVIKREEAEEANRTKSEFLANMSHEIRTPMNAVFGFSELLGQTELSLQQKTYLESIRSGTRGLLTIINDILDVSKLESGKFTVAHEPVDLPTLFRHTELIFAEALKNKGLQFCIQLPSNLPSTIICDEIRLQQILNNLMGNAIKFTEKGSVRINVTFDCPADDRISLDIAVCDTGIGIPKDQQDHIFNAFQQMESQSARRYGGTGLGLTISQKLAVILGGSLTVKSVLGEGTCFHLTFESLEITQESALKDTAALAKYQFEPARILIVDDVASNRLLLKELFRHQPFTLYEGENGEEEVQLAKAHRPHLVLTDLRMPIMDGYEATKILKQDPDTKDIPIIALTASTILNDPQAAEAGFDGYLRKPITGAMVFDIMSNFLPHSKTTIECAPIANETPLPTISAQTMQYYQQDLLPKIEVVEQSGQFDEINKLAEFLRSIPPEHQHPNFPQIAEKLENASLQFDIEGLQIALRQIRQILSVL